VSINANGYLVLSSEVLSQTSTITIKCVLNSDTNISATKAVSVNISNAPQPAPTTITIVGPSAVNGYSGEANDNAAHFIVHDQNNY
jgi:hypothetical protein